VVGAVALYSAEEEVLPDKRNKAKNAARGEVGRPVGDLPRTNSEGSGSLNEIAAKVGSPVGVEDIEIEFPRSREPARAVDLVDYKDRPALKPRKID
jgi:hypothetical protein